MYDNVCVCVCVTLEWFLSTPNNDTREHAQTYTDGGLVSVFLNLDCLVLTVCRRQFCHRPLETKLPISLSQHIYIQLGTHTHMHKHARVHTKTNTLSEGEKQRAQFAG